MNYVIFDLEATCWQTKKGENETIEIGAILINEIGETVSTYNEFIKPLRNPILSEFCTELTTIEQSDVDGAAHFHEVVKTFKSWFECSKGNYWLCSWGFYDRKQLEADCQLHNLETEWLKRHISLKHQHSKINGLRRPMGMKGALKYDKLQLEGVHHRGIDDAKNISKIFLKHFDKWNFEER